MSETIIIGSGGHAGVVIDILGSLDTTVTGLLDDYLQPGKIRHGIEIVGNVKDLIRIADLHNWFIAVGDNAGRSVIAGFFHGDLTQVLPDAMTICSPHATLLGRMPGIGTVICAGAVVGNNSQIGHFSIINTNASLDHDCEVGDFCHLAPGVVTGGHVKIGNGTMIGMGAVIRDHTTIGNNCFIGMGSVVIGDVPDNSVGWGNPWKSQTIK